MLQIQEGKEKKVNKERKREKDKENYRNRKRWLLLSNKVKLKITDIQTLPGMQYKPNKTDSKLAEIIKVSRSKH